MGELPPLGEREPAASSAQGSASPDIVEGVLHQPYARARDTVVADFEGRYLRSLLARTDHNVAKAAREADMNRSYLSALLQKHGIRRQ